MFLLCKFLRLFFNTWTENGKYFRLYGDNLTQQIEILLSQKPKTFSQLSSEILKLP